jgi:hypothetical protein
MSRVDRMAYLFGNLIKCLILCGRLGCDTSSAANAVHGEELPERTTPTPDLDNAQKKNTSQGTAQHTLTETYLDWSLYRFLNASFFFFLTRICVELLVLARFLKTVNSNVHYLIISAFSGFLHHHID